MRNFEVFYYQTLRYFITKDFGIWELGEFLFGNLARFRLGSNRALAAKKTEEQKQDWKEVLVDIILKIITLGLYHVEKHSKK